MSEARKLNPNDVPLMMSQANIYIRLGDNDKLAEIFKEALEKDPNNYLTHWNLGTIRMKQGEIDNETKNYFLKSIELNDQYFASYQNLVAFILMDEKIIVEKMNNLNSKSRFTSQDYTQYDLYKEQRKVLYRECLPYLIKMNEIENTNIDVLKQLRGVYDILDDEDNKMIMHNRIKELQNQ